MPFIITDNSKVEDKHRLYEAICTLCKTSRWVRKSKLKDIKQCYSCRDMGTNIYEKVKERFLIDIKTHCHVWTSYTSKDGYAVIKFKKIRYRVAKLILEKKLKRSIIEGKETCHTCGNRLCINPDHLYEGTHLENGADMARAGSVKGEKCGTCKITKEIAIKIKNFLNIKTPCKQIAETVGVPVSIVKNIKYKNYWYWV
jgi:hypothetical protein